MFLLLQITINKMSFLKMYIIYYLLSQSTPSFYLFIYLFSTSNGSNGRMLNCINCWYKTFFFPKIKFQLLLIKNCLFQFSHFLKLILFSVIYKLSVPMPQSMYDKIVTSFPHLKGFEEKKKVVAIETLQLQHLLICMQCVNVK